MTVRPPESLSASPQPVKLSERAKLPNAHIRFIIVAVPKVKVAETHYFGRSRRRLIFLQVTCNKGGSTVGVNSRASCSRAQLAKPSEDPRTTSSSTEPTLLRISASTLDHGRRVRGHPDRPFNALRSAKGTDEDHAGPNTAGSDLNVRGTCSGVVQVSDDPEVEFP